MESFDVMVHFENFGGCQFAYYPPWNNNLVGVGLVHSQTPPTFSEWHNVYMEVLPNLNSRIFIDGVLVDVSNQALGSPLNINGNIYIANEIGGSRSYYRGKIDDIRIYNRALTQEEISYLAGH